jgi:hypothetical protein
LYSYLQIKKSMHKKGTQLTQGQQFISVDPGLKPKPCDSRLYMPNTILYFSVSFMKQWGPGPDAQKVLNKCRLKKLTNETYFLAASGSGLLICDTRFPYRAVTTTSTERRK